MKHDYMGRPSGEAFVEFVSNEEAGGNDRKMAKMGLLRQVACLFVSLSCRFCMFSHPKIHQVFAD